MLAPVTLGILAHFQLFRLHHIDTGIRAIYVQRITCRRRHLGRIRFNRIAKLNFEVSGRQRINHEMTRAIGHHKAVKPSNAHHQRRVTEQHIAFDR